jgi:hypothetical protein
MSSWKERLTNSFNTKENAIFFPNEDKTTNSNYNSVPRPQHGTSLYLSNYGIHDQIQEFHWIPRKYSNDQIKYKTFHVKNWKEKVEENIGSFSLIKNEF